MKKRIGLFFLLVTIAGCAQPDRASVAGTSAGAVSASGNTAKENVTVTSLQQTASAPAITLLASEAERIVDEGRWGLSVLNPSTGVIEYYTSAGVFLGRRTQGEV